MVTPKAKSGSERRLPRRRAVLYGLLLLLVILLGGSLAVAPLLLPVLMRPAIEAAAAGLGIGDVRFHVAHVGWRSATLTGVSLGDPEAGPGASIEAVRIVYSPRMLLGGRIGALTLERPTVAAAYGDGGLDLGPLAPLLDAGSQGGDAPGKAPVGAVRIAAGRAILHTPDGPLEAGLDGDVRLLAEGSHKGEVAVVLSGLADGTMTLAWTAERGAARLHARNLTLSASIAGSEASLREATLEVSRAGSDAAMHLAGPVELAFETGPVAAASFELDLSGHAAPEAGTAELALAACMPVRLVPRAGTGVEAEGIEICPAGEAPIAAIDATPQGAAVTARLRVPGFAVAADGLLAGTMPEMDVSASAGVGPTLVTARLGGGRITLPGQAVRLEGLDARVSAVPGEGGGEIAKLVVSRLMVTDLAEAVRFAPAVLSGTVGLARDGADMVLSGPVTVAMPGGVRLASGQLRHDIASGEGHLEMETGRLAFAPDGLQPQAVAPALAGVVAAVTGTASISGRLAWSSAGPGASSGVVDLTGIGLQAAAARFGDVSGRIRFSSLWPVRTDGPQTVRIGVLDAGMPLTGGTASVEISGRNEVVIRNAEWPFAGGALVVTSEALRPGADVQRAELEAMRIDLAQFLALVDLEGLTGTGMLAGRVPVEIRDGSVFVNAAVLEAEPGGVINYRSASAQAAGDTAEGASLAFQALENFRFRVLRVEVDGPVDGDLVIRVELEGSNPEVYEGYPIKLNIRTEGAFMDLMRRGTVGFRPLDVISGEEDLRGIDVERVDPGAP